MKKQLSVKTVICILFLVVNGCGKQSESSVADVQFQQQIAVGASINNELRIEVSGSEDAPYDPMLGLRLKMTYVQNIGAESIIFSDELLSVRAYRFDEESEVWFDIDWQIRSLSEGEFVLHPSSTGDLSQSKKLLIDASPLDWLKGSGVRFYIFGIGEDSGKIYGAYIDLEIK